MIGTSSYATRAVTSDKLKTANIAGGGTFYPLIGSNYTGDVDVYAISSPNYKYDLGINQLVVSSISASFTGSLLGTGSYALNALSASYAPSSPAFPYAGNAVITGSLVMTGSIAVNTGDITVTPSGATTKIAITDGFMKNEMKKTSTVIANQASPYNISLGSYVYDPVSSPFFPLSNAIYSTGATDLLISSAQKLNIEATSTVISSSLNVSGSTTINNILTLVPRTTTPTGIASGSIIVSGSATGIKPYFWNGATWTPMF